MCWVGQERTCPESGWRPEKTEKPGQVFIREWGQNRRRGHEQHMAPRVLFSEPFPRKDEPCRTYLPLLRHADPHSNLTLCPIWPRPCKLLRFGIQHSGQYKRCQLLGTKVCRISPFCLHRVSCSVTSPLTDQWANKSNRLSVHFQGANTILFFL